MSKDKKLRQQFLYKFADIALIAQIVAMVVFLLAITFFNRSNRQISQTKGVVLDNNQSALATQTLEGNLRVVFTDDFRNKRSEKKYFIQADDLSITPLDYQGNLDLVPGSKIRVNGSKSTTSALSVNPDLNQGSLEIVSSAEPVSSQALATGTMNVAIISFQFSNQPYSTPLPGEVLTLVNSTVKNFYTENSYGKLVIAGTAYGKYTLPITSTCDKFTLVQNAVKAADADINFNNFKEILLVYKADPACAGQGWGMVGVSIYQTNEGTKELMDAGIPAENWNPTANGNGYFKYILAHEMGHNYGAGHANGWECGSVSINGSCHSEEYGDSYDIMGSNINYLFHFGSFYKESFGWFNTGNIKSANITGKYLIYPLEKAGSSPISLKIPLPGSNLSYYVENRSRTGTDVSLPDNVINGALIKMVGPISSGVNTQGIDSTPQSRVSYDFSDAGYAYGKVLNDSTKAIAIKPVSKDSNGVLTVDVTLGGSSSTLKAPTLISPANGAADVKTLRPKFDWSDVSGASSYRIQLSYYSNMATPFVDSVTAAGSYYTPSIYTKRKVLVYWRVMAKNSTSASSWSSIFHYTSPNPPSAPSLVSPKIGVTVASVRPTFTWAASTLNPATYDIRISASSTLSPITYMNTSLPLSPTSFRIPQNLASKTLYYWRMYARNSKGEVSPPSATWTFRTP